MQHSVNARDCILHYHTVLAHEHKLCERQGDDRRDDNIKQQVQQHIAVRAAVREQESSCNQENKHAVDRQGVEGHGSARLLCVGDNPALIVINGALELFEGKYRLSEGFDNRDSPYIFYRFVGHICQCVLILCHLILHSFAGHAGHNKKSERHRHKAQKSKPPIENQQQRQKSRDGRHSLGFVGQLMGEISFCRPGSLGNGAAQLTAAEPLNGARR